MIKPFSDACFEMLKSRVLNYANLNKELFDADTLKKIIVKKTGHEISTYALNRAFDIIPGKFNPSAYTLNVLAIYCGYAGWNDFYLTSGW